MRHRSSLLQHRLRSLCLEDAAHKCLSIRQQESWQKQHTPPDPPEALAGFDDASGGISRVSHNGLEMLSERDTLDVLAVAISPAAVRIATYNGSGFG